MTRDEAIVFLLGKMDGLRIPLVHEDTYMYDKRYINELLELRGQIMMKLFDIQPTSKEAKSE